MRRPNALRILSPKATQRRPASFMPVRQQAASRQRWIDQRRGRRMTMMSGKRPVCWPLISVADFSRATGAEEGSKAMKFRALCGAGFLLMSATAMAQSNSEALRACNLPSYAERMKCLERLADGIAPALPGVAAKPVPAPSPDTAPSLAVPPAPATPAPAASPAPTAASEWTVSEIRSPLDYSRLPGPGHRTWSLPGY